MIKGVGKQIVIIKNPDSKIFEEAIFILKDGAKVHEPDLLNECKRIIKNTNRHNNRPKRNTIKTISIITASAIFLVITYLILINFVM